MVENRITRSIPCEDISGRTRELQVIGSGGRIAFVAPPGEVANVHPQDYDALKHALRDALGVAVNGLLAGDHR